MAEFTLEPQQKEVTSQDSQTQASESRLGFLRRLVKEQMERAKQEFKLDSGKDEPTSSFLRSSKNKVRSDLSLIHAQAVAEVAQKDTEDANLQLEKAQKTAQEAIRSAQYDKKTGLLTNESFVNQTQQEMTTATEDPDHYKLLIGFTDLDNFGVLNPIYGETKVDKMLKTISDTFKKSFRSNDITGRFGGEELSFTLPYHIDSQTQLPDTDDEMFPGTRVRKAIEAIPLSPEFPRKMTASVGVTEYVPGEDLETTLNRASLATRIGKFTGKNKTIVALPRRDGGWEYKDLKDNLIFIPTTETNANGVEEIVSIHEDTTKSDYKVIYETEKKPWLQKV